MAGGQQTVAERVLDAVSNATDEAIVDLPPLYDSVDPEALNALTDGMENGVVWFTYAGHEVTATSDGTVRLADERRSFRGGPATLRND